MSHSTAGLFRRPQPNPLVPATSRLTRARRGVQWLLVALMLCEWQYSAPRPLWTEQRSARSAIGIKRCRKIAACADSMTYLASSLGPGETLRRWPDDGAPITVWIAEASGTPTRAQMRRRIARDAFHVWTDAGVPQRFVFVPDSVGAMVQVLWRKQLPDRRAGQVTRRADDEGWLRAAVVELSIRNMAGAIQDTATLRAVALHEVGHLLGLEHSPDVRDIMAPWVVARQLSPRDRATAQTLYSPGLLEEEPK
ncbi:MAG: matrixin family metalloprotease [Gemmatimonadaceae bacterium]